MREAFQARFKAPFATLGITTSETHLTGVRFLPPDTPALMPQRESIAHLACVQLYSYFENPRFVFDVPIRLAGTHHRLQVWEAMCRIPAGKFLTYGEIARELHSSARAVGGACGANPVPVLVPCHRVVAANGALGGFMGSREEGFELGIKRWLLEHEGAL